MLSTSRSSGGTGDGAPSNNRTVNFAGDASLVDRFVDLRITEARHYTLRGELAGAPARTAHAA